MSGRREKFTPRGGPDGGDGGTGGSVYVRCDRNVSNLGEFEYHRRFVGVDGGHGTGGLKHGKRGGDAEFVVPVGTEVRDISGGSRLVADMTEHEQREMVVRGGRGGRGNSHFATATTQFPLLAEEGDPGREVKLELVLRLLADVGIIGSPNAGKSTLLAAVSSARPRIAAYPFSTIEASLGVASHDGREFVLVDIPGLVEGAHMGAGLGHQFLRHVSRTRVLLHIVDGALDDAPTEYYKVREELQQYGQGLDGKPEILAINKLDVPGVRDDGMNRVGKLDGGGRAVHLISALTGEGVSELLDTVVETLGSLVPSTDGPADSEPEREEVLRPVAIGKTKVVRKVRGEYLVTLRAATRLAGMIKSDNWQAQAQLFQQFSRLGVMDALQEAGIRPGEKFKIGKQSWEWE